MVAESVDVVVGVDTHRDRHALALVDARTGALIGRAGVTADRGGYREAVRVADGPAGSRVWAVKGCGSYGAGLTRFRCAHGERVLEVERPVRARGRDGRLKDDGLDALRAARMRPGKSAEPERQAAMLALKSCARRVRLADREASTLERELDQLVRALCPWLLELIGVGPITAAQLLVSWSHPGRLRSEAAFARLAGVAPIPASSGKHIRYRLDRGGDRRLNRALHSIILSCRRHDPDTIAYIERRQAEGKTAREAIRCLKRFLARSLYRKLETTPITT